MGVGLGSLGVGGGAAITAGSGGTATLGGVAVAGAAIVAGGVYVGAGTADVLNGIVMMAQGNGSGGNNRTDHGQQRHEEARGGDPNRDVGDINKIRNEGRHFRDTETGNTIHVKGDKVVVDKPNGDFHTSFHNTKANTATRIETGKWIPLE
jgi:hypothetical protein